MALVNGRLASSQLATIPGTTRRIRADLVTQVAALRQAFEHRFGKPLVVTDGYRSYEEQESLFRARYTTTYLAGRPYKTWNGTRWYQRPGTAMASVPGYSNHGLGEALDLGSNVNVRGTAEHNWVVQNAPRFGFRWPSEWAQSAGEWWHFEDGTAVPASNYISFPGVNISAPGGTLPDPLEEDFVARMSDEHYEQFMGAVVRINSWLPAIKENTDRLPRIHATTDTTLAATGNITNGVIAIINKVNALDVDNVDEQALAAAIAPLLTDVMLTLSTEDLEKIAKAVNDETTRRMQE